MMVKLNVRAFGLACGIVWAAGLFALGIFSSFLDWGRLLVTVLGSLYPGYSSALPGIIAGTLWAFVDGAVFGALVAWLYNKIIKRVESSPSTKFTVSLSNCSGQASRE